MAVDWGALSIGSGIVVGLAMVALGGWLLVLDARNRVHLSFAVFLLFRGVVNVASAFTAAERIDEGALVGVLRGAALGTPLLLAWFGLEYARAHTPLRVPRALILWTVVGAVALSVAGALRPALYFEGPTLGPLAWLYGVRILGYALLGLFFSVLFRAAPGAARAPSLFLMALGACLDPLFLAVQAAAVRALTGQATYAIQALPANFALVLLAGPAALAAVAVLLTAPLPSRGQASGRRRARWTAAVVGLCVVSAPAITLLTLDASMAATGALFNMVDLVWTIAFPMLVTYAILRHHLFDIDVKVKWTVRQSTVAGAFVTVFFVASEGTQAFFDGSGNEWVGIGAAALLVFALSPLQRFADGVANAAMPNVASTPEFLAFKRLEVYRAAVESAWKDGRVSRDERAMLDRLKRELKLRDADAKALEAEVTA